MTGKSRPERAAALVQELDMPQLKKKTPIRCWLGIHRFPPTPINGHMFPLFWIVRCQHGCGKPEVRRNWMT